MMKVKTNLKGIEGEEQIPIWQYIPGEEIIDGTVLNGFSQNTADFKKDLTEFLEIDEESRSLYPEEESVIYVLTLSFDLEFTSVERISCEHSYDFVSSSLTYSTSSSEEGIPDPLSPNYLGKDGPGSSLQSVDPEDERVLELDDLRVVLEDHKETRVVEGKEGVRQKREEMRKDFERVANLLPTFINEL